MSRAAAARRARCALVAALALACGRAPAWPPSARELRAGEEVCQGCRMLVSDPRFAVQLHSRAGAVDWFDDLGCLLAGSEPAIEPEAVFARDFGSDAWVRGVQGHAVRLAGLDSPMGSGWSVHASDSAARAAAQAEGAERVALSELLLRRVPQAQQRSDEAPATNTPGED